MSAGVDSRSPYGVLRTPYLVPWGLDLPTRSDEEPQIVVEIVCEGRSFCLKENPVAVDELKVRIMQTEKIRECTGGFHALGDPCLANDKVWTLYPELTSSANTSNTSGSSCIPLHCAWFSLLWRAAWHRCYGVHGYCLITICYGYYPGCCLSITNASIKGNDMPVALDTRLSRSCS